MLADIKNDVHIAGYRTLGIISKSVTGPLWRKMEDDSHILTLNSILGNLHAFLKEAKDDSNDVITGNLRPFDWEGEDDRVSDELFEPDATDALTVEILQCLFNSMLIILERQAADHLPGGKFFLTTPELEEETKSALKHNKLPEYFFGQLDRLMKFRPNASALCNEAYIMFLHNKTCKWLDDLPEDERDRLLEESRKEGREIREKFKAKMKMIQKKREEALKKKEEEIKAKRLRILKQKESLTDSVLYYGLWQSEEGVKQHLLEISKTPEQIKALKAQLNFRKNVLKQIASDKKLFLFSEGGKKKSVEQLTTNLCRLISESRIGSTSEKPAGTGVLLVGKTVDHQFTDKVYRGRVLSVVPGFSTWYNIKYKDDPAVYVYQLQEDYQNGDLTIVP